MQNILNGVACGHLFFFDNNKIEQFSKNKKIIKQKATEMIVRWIIIEVRSSIYNRALI